MVNGRQKGRGKDKEKGDVRVEVGLEKYRARKAWADALGWPLRIGAFALPLMPVYWAVDSLAGQQTTVEVSLLATITATISVTMTGVAGVLLAKNRAQKKELERLRERAQMLEAPLLERRKEVR